MMTNETTYVAPPEPVLLVRPNQSLQGKRQFHQFMLPVAQSEDQLSNTYMVSTHREVRRVKTDQKSVVCPNHSSFLKTP